MPTWNRREFLQQSWAWGGAALLASSGVAWADDASRLELATFRADISPPEGHPLCGGWIKPVVGQDDPQFALGLVLLGAGDPIVLCSVDWTGLLNEAHIRWRETLAQAAGTTPDRVAVQCVHQHNAPFVCLEAQRLCARHDDLKPAVVQVDFFERSLERTAEALRKSLAERRPVTHVAANQAQVEKVAGNRRFVGEDGTITNWRGSSSKNPVHHELPEGLIDPYLKTVAFYNGNERLAALHYYATHPMSYYGDGRVSSDFVGLARRRLQQEDPAGLHVYFTGCSGNVAAGKYNNGTPEARRQLTDRMFAAMSASMSDLKPQPIQQVGWQTQEILPAPRSGFIAERLIEEIANSQNALANRIRPSMMLSWLGRCEQQIPIVLSALHIDGISLLHLPAESFVEYQLRAQQAAPNRFIATAAYGDGGPWYIPTSQSYPQGGYEVSVAFCEPTIDDMLDQGIRKLLAVG
jgi:hypothetical protein